MSEESGRKGYRDRPPVAAPAGRRNSAGGDQRGGAVGWSVDPGANRGTWSALRRTGAPGVGETWKAKEQGGGRHEDLAECVGGHRCDVPFLGDGRRGHRPPVGRRPSAGSRGIQDDRAGRQEGRRGHPRASADPGLSEQPARQLQGHDRGGVAGDPGHGDRRGGEYRPVRVGDLSPRGAVRLAGRGASRQGHGRSHRAGAQHASHPTARHADRRHDLLRGTAAYHHQQARPDRGRHEGFQAAGSRERRLSGHGPGLGSQADPDDVRRAVPGAAAERGGRPGESAPHHRVRQILRGTEVPGAHQPYPDSAIGAGQREGLAEHLGRRSADRQQRRGRGDCLEQPGNPRGRAGAGGQIQEGGDGGNPAGRSNRSGNPCSTLSPRCSRRSGGRASTSGSWRQNK